MPQRALRPGNNRRDTRASSNRRGYDWQWRKIRAAFLAEHPRCVACGAPAQHVDHRVPLAAGGTHDPSNLQAMCHRCHSRKTVLRDGGFGHRRPGQRAQIQRVKPENEVVTTQKTRLSGEGGLKSLRSDAPNHTTDPNKHNVSKSIKGSGNG
jgi:hypothetical protein